MYVLAGGLADDRPGVLGGGLFGDSARPRDNRDLTVPVILNLKEELLKRLPAGTILDEDKLAKLAGGLAKGLAMPEKFASLAEMEDWVEMIKARVIGGGDIRISGGDSGNTDTLV